MHLAFPIERLAEIYDSAWHIGSFAVVEMTSAAPPRRLY
jgi:hypothetical protein